MYQCYDFLALYKLGQIALLIHIEDNDRHISFAAESECSLVHNLETILDSLVEAKLLILDRRRILIRIRCIDSIHTSSLE